MSLKYSVKFFNAYLSRMAEITFEAKDVRFSFVLPLEEISHKFHHLLHVDEYYIHKMIAHDGCTCVYASVDTITFCARNSELDSSLEVELPLEECREAFTSLHNKIQKELYPEDYSTDEESE